MTRYLPLLLAALLALGILGCKDQPTLVNNTPDPGGPPVGQDGAACTSDNRCDGAVCLDFGLGWRGGYCTTENCVAAGCNGDDAVCIEFIDGSSFCLDGCEKNSECRNGYRCMALNSQGGKVCYRDLGDGPPVGAIGSDCTDDADCRGELLCDLEAPGGYCVGTTCDDCPRESVCGEFNGVDRCVAECEVTRDCRDGYLCDDEICRPAPPIDVPIPFETTLEVLGVACGGEVVSEESTGTVYRVAFDVPAGIAGYVMVPFVETGALRPLSLELPSGTVVDLVSDYRHHNLRAGEFQFFDQESDGAYGRVALDWPIMVPYTPERADLLESGRHVLELIATVAEPCIYIATAAGSGTTIDLNVIFMGVEGYSAAMADTDPDLAEVFATVNEILSPLGLGVGEIRYFDAPQELRERYAHIEDEFELRRATAFGVPRGETLAGHLNVDMFLVEAIRLGGGALVLGLSAGLPGPPGLHGNPANGLVFSATDIGSQNAFVGHIMAHELGHYVGLRHTTEVVHQHPEGVEFDAVLGTTDPIEDTPVCNSVLFQGPDCPDATNLMFPSAPPTNVTPTLTEGQGAVLRASPLFK